ncbi:MAG: DUF5930 domain-containing protein [Paracoccaceae bacterium]
MVRRLGNRANTALSRILPEQRLFLRSDTETRFIRLSPATQLSVLAGAALVVTWAIISAAIIMIDQIGADSVREQARREQSVYATRLDMMSIERDRRTEEARLAQQRFSLALEEVSKMQSALLASEDRRRELETGIEVIQSTLSRTMQERDSARLELATAQAEATGTGTELASAETDPADVLATLGFLTDAMGTVAVERDRLTARAETAVSEAEELAFEKRLMEQRNDQIFTKLEEAVTVSMEPLDKMFSAAGMDPDDVLNQVRRGYSGQGGPLLPIGFAPEGDATLSTDEARANTILEGLDRMNMYRIAAEKAPFAMPVKSAFRFTSGFGMRRDPKGAGTRMHAGTDFAAASGTPIYATADGTVVHAGWQSGYGRLIKIQHAFGIETRYAHLSEIRVEVGQKVSRGDRIGDMGNSGRSTGTHLHYEVRSGGNAVNPMIYIKAANNVF